MNNGPSVSLCMIAKNEEHCITSCIHSVRHLVKEVIVVDTGSTDRTRELAAASGAKVFPFPWGDDFAAARNYSLDQATGEWILVLDADEILEPVKAEELAGLLAAPDVEGYFVNIRSYLGKGEGTAEDQVVRLFRNKSAYRFEGAIHERIAGSIQRHSGGKSLAFSNLLIHHFGYLDRLVQAKNKHRRNIWIIQKALREKPADPFLLFSLGIEYFQCGEIARGIEKLERALVLMRGDEGYFRDLLFTLCVGLYKEGQKEKLTFMLDRALSMLPADPDLHLLRGVLAWGDGRFGTALEELRFARAGGSRIVPLHYLHTLLGDGYNLSDRCGEAEGEYFNALRLAPHNLYPLTQILGLKQRNKSRTEWGKLAGFCSPGKKKTLWEELRKMGELPLALVLALLAVVEAAASGDSEQSRECCRAYKLLVEEYIAGGYGRELIGNYLLAGAEEMLIYAGAVHKRLDCELFPFGQGLLRLASSTLELVVRTLCPPWSPQPNLKL